MNIYFRRRPQYKKVYDYIFQAPPPIQCSNIVNQDITSTCTVPVHPHTHCIGNGASYLYSLNFFVIRAGLKYVYTLFVLGAGPKMYTYIFCIWGEAYNMYSHTLYLRRGLKYVSQFLYWGRGLKYGHTFCIVSESQGTPSVCFVTSPESNVRDSRYYVISHFLLFYQNLEFIKKKISN